VIQTIVIVALFAGAVFYLGRMLFKAFRPAKSGCEGECKCSESKIQLPTNR
jgi:hypothetical protein